MDVRQKIAVLGGGESGCGSAILAKVKGHEVLLSDNGRLAPEYAAMLDRHGIEYEHGGHTESRIWACDLIIKSPGIPETVPIVSGALERGIPVVSEIEFAGRYTKGRSICITGSNGKTTTTTLIYEILLRAGFDVALAGNIGKSFAYTVATDDKDWYVMELSSFQLDGMYDYRADIAVLLNITPDHLDRYDHDFGKYARSKMRILQNQRPEDSFVYWTGDRVIRELLDELNPDVRLLPFGDAPGAKEDAYLDESGSVPWIHARAGGREVRIDSGRMMIKGRHNLHNAMAAALATLAAGVDTEVIADTIHSFPGVEHRMEFVAEVDGVKYINDSKATNVDSVWYALQCVERPLIWIAGGTDKGNDYEPLKAFVAEKAKALVCLGTDNSKLIASFTDVAGEVYDTHSMAEAVARCREIARPGDTVLLSPACASFDLFRNYEDRGRQFKKNVLAMR